MSEGTKTLGNSKALTSESWGFVHKKEEGQNRSPFFLSFMFVRHYSGKVFLKQYPELVYMETLHYPPM